MISHTDHLVLTVRSLEDRCACYEHAFGCARGEKADPSTALKFGRCTINVHLRDYTLEPKAGKPIRDSADFRPITEKSLEEEPLEALLVRLKQ